MTGWAENFGWDVQIEWPHHGTSFSGKKHQLSCQD